MQLIDTHCHIHLDDFDQDRENVIQRARDNGVQKIIVLATDVASSEAVVALGQKYAEVFVAVGIHPCQAHLADPDAMRRIRSMAESNEKVVAIGETGLDFYWEKEHFAIQYQLFREQLDLAAELDLPVVIHTREAQREIQWFFQEQGIVQLHGVMHCFEGDSLDARFYLEMGLHLSFTANITYAGYPHPQVLRQIPTDRLMIETDSPYIAPQNARGKRNEPANVLAVAERMAAILQIPVEEVARLTTDNARRFFRLPD